jgi:cytochrome c551/c552
MARRNRPRPIVAVGEVVMWLLFAALLVPAGVVGWAIGHYTGHHGGTRTVTVAASTAPATTAAATTAAASTASATTTASAASGGKAVFVSSGCGACHTFTPAGTTATVGPNLDTTPTESAKADGNMPLAAFVKQSIVDPNAYIAKGFPKGVMPGTFASQLSKTQLADLVTFIVAGQKK